MYISVCELRSALVGNRTKKTCWLPHCIFVGSNIAGRGIS